jgi:hypothetical protein
MLLTKDILRTLQITEIVIKIQVSQFNVCIIVAWVMAPCYLVINIFEEHTASFFSVKSFLKDGDRFDIEST